LPRSGFCTGTGDGVLVVRLYVRLRPQGNPLARYLPALELIDRQGGGGDVSGLDGFIQAVQAAGRSDPLFRQAQDRLADELYFAPSQRLAKALGFRLALSKAQLYDAYIQHGYSDPGYDVYDISGGCQGQMGGGLWSVAHFFIHRGAQLEVGAGKWKVLHESALPGASGHNLSTVIAHFAARGLRQQWRQHAPPALGSCAGGRAPSVGQPRWASQDVTCRTPHPLPLQPTVWRIG
jgi:hypothetical protein